MRLFGFEITRQKDTGMLAYDRPSAWFPVIREPFTGAWQRNISLRPETVLAYNAVYACVKLIASDIAKLGLRLVEQDENGVWTAVDSPAFSPVLRKPNRYQNRLEFIQQWVISKLINGNTYVLKERDNRGVVVAMYVLDPNRTKALVAPDGEVYYQLSPDNLAGIEDSTPTFPASEIIHDKMTPLYHPLCGVSPLTACGMAALQGMTIQQQSTAFFQNQARPSVLLTAAGKVGQETVDRIKAHWEENYSALNAGRPAILGDGLTAEILKISASDSQLIEQLKWSAETVCSCFGVPPYMVGVGPMPSYNNVEALNQQYYQQCLQALIEALELCLDEGLGLTTTPAHVYGTEFDLDDLLRMDTATQIKTYAEGVKGGLLMPNEGRKKLNAGPVTGGDQVYLQQQNFSLAALAKRDAQDDPFGTSKPAPEPAAPPANDNQAEEMQAALAEIRKGLSHARL